VKRENNNNYLESRVASVVSANPLLKFLCFLDIINMSFCLDESKSIGIDVTAFCSFSSLSTTKLFILSEVDHLLH
jgi:hypothetical protein